MSVNDDIRDEFATHDIDLRRVDGGIQNQVDKILVQLGKDLKVLTVKIDPNGTTRRDAQKRRTKKLREESRPLINEAYVKISALVRSDLRRISKVESKASLSIIREAIP